MRVSKSCIAAKDFDHDGDIDIFAGGRVIPGKYPVTPRSFLLQNNEGRFENKTIEPSPGLFNIGMVTDATWIDVNKDECGDRVTIGEYMNVEVFLQNQGKH